MDLQKTKKHWQSLAKQDPLWAVLSWDNKKNGQWDIKEFFETGRSEILVVKDYLSNLSLSLAGFRALDFGCGVGRLTQGLSPYFSSVLGVDISECMVDQAEKLNNKPNCYFKLNTTADLKIIPDNYFSFIYSRLTFQHMDPKYTKSYIKEFVRVLEPGGVALFSQPAHKNILKVNKKNLSVKQLLRIIIPWRLQNFFRNFFSFFTHRPVMELFSISPKIITEELKKTGVEIVYIDKFGDLGPAWETFRYCIKKPN